MYSIDVDFYYRKHRLIELMQSSLLWIRNYNKIIAESVQLQRQIRNLLPVPFGVVVRAIVIQRYIDTPAFQSLETVVIRDLREMSPNPGSFHAHFFCDNDYTPNPGVAGRVLFIDIPHMHFPTIVPS